jgi:peroxiredoxin
MSYSSLFPTTPNTGPQQGQFPTYGVIPKTQIQQTTNSSNYFNTSDILRSLLGAFTQRSSPTNQPQYIEQKTDYTPYIIGGVALLAVVLLTRK